MMFKLIIKWLALLPLSLLTTIAAWLCAPVIVLFHDDKYRLPKRWQWASTPTSNLLGDAGHRARWKGRSRYLQMVAWIYRNPACVAQKTPPLGFEVAATDSYHAEGDEATADNAGGHSGRVLRIIKRDGKPAAFQLYVVHQYAWHPSRCLRVCLGWKLWARPEPGYRAQLTGRISPFKHFG